MFTTSTNTVDMSGPAAAVDVAFGHIQSKYIDAICHDRLELSLPGHTGYYGFLCKYTFLIIML